MAWPWKTFRKNPKPTPAQTEAQIAREQVERDIATRAAFEILEEKRDFAEHISQEANNPHFLTCKSDGSLNINAMYTGMLARWITDSTKPESIARAEYDYDAFDTYAKIDIPFDEQTRQKFPHAIGNATNLKDLIPPAIRSYMGALDYFWKEGKSNKDTCIKALINLSRDYDRIVALSPEEAAQEARDLTEKEHIPLKDISALAHAIYNAPEVLGMIEKEKEHQTNIPIKTYEGSAADLANALKSYEHSMADTDPAPNPYLVEFIRKTSAGLNHKLLSPNVVMEFLGRYHEDYKTSLSSELRPSAHSQNARSFDTLNKTLEMLQSSDKGANRGWLDI